MALVSQIIRFFFLSHKRPAAASPSARPAMAGARAKNEATIVGRVYLCYNRCATSPNTGCDGGAIMELNLETLYNETRKVLIAINDGE